jgi:gliding motility-associated-like protein
VGIDQYGCTDTAGTAVVEAFAFTEPLSVSVVDPVCSGEDILATAAGSGVVNWYADPALSQVVGTGTSLVVEGIVQSTTVYLVQNEAPCTSQPLPLVLPVIQLPPAPVVQGDTLLCVGDGLFLTVPITATANWSTPFGNFTQPGVTQPNMTSSLAGTYTVFYSDNGCVGPTTTVHVRVDPLPPLDLGPDREICLGEVVELDAGAGIGWLWSTGGQERTILVQEGAYSVMVTGSSGCTAMDTVVISAGDCEVPVNNAITPNDDGVNDLITVTSPSDAPLTLEIFNRWGQQLFSRSSRIVQWDGRNGISGEPVPAGVYFYVLQAMLPNGNPFTRNGYLHVMR